MYRIAVDMILYQLLIDLIFNFDVS
jgi:hypothetical protein